MHRLRFLISIYSNLRKSYAVDSDDFIARREEIIRRPRAQGPQSARARAFKILHAQLVPSVSRRAGNNTLKLATQICLHPCIRGGIAYPVAPCPNPHAACSRREEGETRTGDSFALLARRVCGDRVMERGERGEERAREGGCAAADEIGDEGRRRGGEKRKGRGRERHKWGVRRSPVGSVAAGGRSPLALLSLASPRALSLSIYLFLSLLSLYPSSPRSQSLSLPPSDSPSPNCLPSPPKPNQHRRA